jgi:D-alanyl-D-alanine carboxypeptidase/D-alanyl-D-alanine-endopeptidase (penicillin-binding protein 4)
MGVARSALAAVLLTLFLALPSTALTGASGLREELTASLRNPGAPLGQAAAIAVDLDDGALLYAHNATTAVVPASAEKLPVSWAALMRLGPTFRFHTDVLGVGRREGTTWVGDLVIKGFGDPTLTSSDLDELAADVFAEGIRHVTGRVRGDESFFDRRRDAPGWKPGFLGIESPPLSALVVDRAHGWPKLSPPLLAARAFREALIRRGVTVAGPHGLGRAPARALLIAMDRSVPLSKIARALNADSDNFSAEMLLKALGASTGGLGTTRAGAAVVMRELRAAGIPTEGVRLADGSGLSPDDRLTAVALVGVLRAGLSDERIRGAFRSSLAVAGHSGTMTRRLPDLRGRVRGKTGTTNAASTLAGLVGSNVAFAVLHHGSPVNWWAARSAQDRFVTVLARR